MATFTILLAGEVAATPRLRAQVAGTRAIAADGGIAHAQALGVAPELWVGDFDSADPGASDVRREMHPAAKDATDGELAVMRARALGATRLVVVGAFGGRTDHAVTHLLAAFGWADLDPLLTSGHEEAVVLGEAPRSPDWREGTTFSVLAFDDVAVTLRGCRWPLDGAAVQAGSSLTMSNEVAGRLEASAAGGRALLVAQLNE